MTTIQDDQLHLHAKRVEGKVALITGAASGIGRETALLYARYGAKVVLGDLNAIGLDQVSLEIKRRGGNAVGQKCDVTSWDEQVALFDLAIAEYGMVDFVIANAGVGEIGSFYDAKHVRGRPSLPELKTVDVNLLGTIYCKHGPIYSARLALYYLEINRSSADSLKAIVMLGSMASWQANHNGPLYSATKHAVLGLARALHPPLAGKNIRISIIHPFFADTSILSLSNKLMILGIAKTPVERIAGTIFFSTTDPSPRSNGSVWLLPDGGPVFRLAKEALREGVYKTINERSKLHHGTITNLQLAADMWDILWKRIVFGLIPVVAGSILCGKL